MNSSPHVYSALPTPFDIRVLVLEPAPTWDSPLHGSFDTAGLTEVEGTYEAISYTWGAPILSFPIIWNDGTHIMITKSLDDALRRFRYTDRKRRLWADAVCINQGDNADKAIQIPRMMKIFRGAKGVLAFLSIGDNGEKKGIKFLDQLSRTSKIDVETCIRTTSENSQNATLDTESDSEAAVLSVVQLSWFSRLWIIQEVVFNADVLLVCGEAEISWPRFNASLTIYKSCIGASPVLRRKIETLSVVFRLWKDNNMVDFNFTGSYRRNDPRYEEFSTHIIDLMIQFTAYDCTDPRDRIFALYSMATDIVPSTTPSPWPSGAFVFDIDYGLDKEETFQKFAVAALKRPKESWPFDATETLKFLTYAIASPHSSLPSWVADWKLPPGRDTPNLSVSGGNLHFSGCSMEELTITLHNSIMSDSRGDIGRFLPIATTASWGDCKESFGGGFKTVASWFEDFHDMAYTKFSSTEGTFTQKIATYDRFSSNGLYALIAKPWGDTCDVSNLATLQPHEIDDIWKKQVPQAILRNRSLFSIITPHSRSFFLGIGDCRLRPGDEVAISFNDSYRGPTSHRVPALILRPRTDRGSGVYELVGDAYVIFSSLADCSMDSKEPRYMCGLRGWVLEERASVTLV